MKILHFKNDVPLLIILLSTAISCRHPAKNFIKTNDRLSVKVDTTKSFRVGTFWVTPRPILKFNSLELSSKDTLDLAICAEYVYSPFGVIKDKFGLKKSLLNNFNVVNIKDSTGGVVSEVQKLYLDSSKLILFFDNDREASKHSYIIKGEIYDNKVSFINNIKIGMDKEDFIKTFFVVFPIELKRKYNIIGFESCVDDIRHIYTFKDNKLASVKFNCVDCTWKVDY